MEANVIRLPGQSVPMTAQQFREFRDRFEDETNTTVALSLNRRSSQPALLLMVYPRAGAAIEATADTFEEATEQLRAVWTERRAQFRVASIRKLAIAIIAATDEHPEHVCTDAALRAQGIEQADIEEYGEEACAKAAEMGGRQPFAIVKLANSNAA